MVLTITNAFQSRRKLIAQAFNVAVCAAAFAFAVSSAHAQYPPYTPPPPPLVLGPCVPSKKNPCTPPPSTTNSPAPAANDNPFPGEDPAGNKPAPPNAASQSAADTNPFPGEPEKPPTAAGTAPGSTSDKNPFPGEPESSSSSSSSPSDPTPDPEPDKPALVDKGSSGTTRMQRRHLPKVEDLDKREADDIDISHYYASTGNFKASYLRAQDAVKTIPDDPLAHFALAESARHLNKNDEAIAEYKLYLKLDPDGEKAKASERALDELAPK